MHGQPRTRDCPGFVSAAGRLGAHPLRPRLALAVCPAVHILTVDVGLEESSLPHQLGNLAFAVGLEDFCES